MVTVITIVTNTDMDAGSVGDAAYCSSALSGDDVEKIEAFIREMIQRSAGECNE